MKHKPESNKQAPRNTGAQQPASHKRPAQTTTINAQNMNVTVTANGPYVVKGNVPLSRQIITPNAEGESWDWTEGEQFEAKDTYHLCRCGGSANKPFCDGTHKKINFDGTEAAINTFYLDQAETFSGPKVTLTDAPELCAFARFCDAKGQIWNLVEQEGEEARDLTIREAGHCPSGRLKTWQERGDGRLQPDGEPRFEPSIGVVEDPQQGVSGPYWVRGGITLTSSDGTTYETRNRMTLCRCGASQNKPFCDGSHAQIGFSDGWPDSH